MIEKIKAFFQTKPLHIFLLPVFFVLHGYIENFGLIGETDAIILGFTYIVFVSVLFAAVLVFFRNIIKTGIVVFTISFICFFFGAGYDFIKDISPAPFLYKYSLLIPFIVLITAAVAWFVKRTKKPLQRTTLYLNLAFVAFIAFDTASLAWQVAHEKVDRLAIYETGEDKIIYCEDCPKPDIFLLLFDEYASSESLSQFFHYNNTAMDSFLTDRGFMLLKQSRSNYNYTPFSMSSMLNMDYLPGIADNHACTVEDYTRCALQIKDNKVIRTLSAQGYEVKNYSVFDLVGNPSMVEQDFLPIKTRLITSNTLLSRLSRDLGWMMESGGWKPGWWTKNNLSHIKRNNDLFIKSVKENARVQAGNPRFIYAHFYMPHRPYYYGAGEKLKDAKMIVEENSDTLVRPYLDYIPYTNSQIRSLVTNIQEQNPSAIIMIMGDHGFRYKSPTSRLYQFQNMNAVFIPGADKTLYAQTTTNVNQFRILFNHLFRQSYSQLADSTFYLTDKIGSATHAD